MVDFSNPCQNDRQGARDTATIVLEKINSRLTEGKGQS